MAEFRGPVIWGLTLRIVLPIVTPAKGAKSKGPVGAPTRSHLFPGLIAGILIGLLIVTPHSRRITSAPLSDPAPNLTDVDHLSPDEIQALIVKALSRLGEQQDLDSSVKGIATGESNERAIYTWDDVQRGIKNLHRLLPLAKRWTLETLQQATAEYELWPSARPRVTQLINGVRSFVRDPDLRSMAAVRDDRLSEIRVDPEYAPYLVSDDVAIFVLAHELTHVAARSGKLNRFIEGVAQQAKGAAEVEPVADQREDLACDFVGALVLKRFITVNPTNDSAATRLSRVLGYESPAERFARAWEDFCLSYNGYSGDDDHLTQYQTIRALLALDPELQSLIPLQAGPSSR